MAMKTNVSTRFGIFCPPAIGHLNPMCALARELQRRGHTVVLFGVPDLLAKVADLGFTVWEIGAAEYPRGSVDAAYKTMGKLTGRAGFKFTIELLQREIQMLFREAPAATRAAEIDVLIIDQIMLPMPTVADFLALPFVTVSNALLFNREPVIPSYSTHWAYDTGLLARWRNQLGNKLIDFLTRNLWREIVTQRQQWQLPPYQGRNDIYSSLAQICQATQDFDFPREQLPAHCHYIGQLQDVSETELISFKNIAFPFERLDGRPLIYASLGSIMNQRPEIFACIAQACVGLDAQLVISLGNPAADIVELPGNPIVVQYVPQSQLIARAQLVITHAGMNTVLTALRDGVPLLAIPIANDQPGVAARLQKSGAGRMMQLREVNEITLRNAITEVLTQPQYRDNARRLQQNIQQAGGVVRAADIIEAVAQTRKPVLR